MAGSYGGVDSGRDVWAAGATEAGAGQMIQVRPDAIHAHETPCILGEYRGDAKRTVERLQAVLDRNDVTLALDRAKRRRVIRLVE